MPRRSAESRTAHAARNSLSFWAMTLVVVALHALPGAELAGQDWWSVQRVDLVLHAALFGLWAMSALIALRKGRSGHWSCRRAWPVVVLGGALLAVFLEWAQGVLFLDRGRDVTDGMADFLGLVVAGFAFRALYLEWPMGKRTL